MGAIRWGALAIVAGGLASVLLLPFAGWAALAAGPLVASTVVGALAVLVPGPLDAGDAAAGVDAVIDDCVQQLENGLDRLKAADARQDPAAGDVRHGDRDGRAA